MALVTSANKRILHATGSRNIQQKIKMRYHTNMMLKLLKSYL